MTPRTFAQRSSHSRFRSLIHAPRERRCILDGFPSSERGVERDRELRTREDAMMMTMKRAKKRLRRLEKQRHLSQSFSLSRAATRSSFAKNASGTKGERRKLSPERARKDENDEPGLRERPSSSRIGHALARFLGVHRRRRVACCALCSRSSSRRAATASRRAQQRAQMLLEALHVFFFDREREPHFLESEKEILEAS